MMIKRLFIWFLFLLNGYLSHAKASNDSVFSKAAIQAFIAGKEKVAGKDFKLFIFLSPECPLCQQAAAGLNKLFQQYNSKVAFYGVVPGKTYSINSVDDFVEKYDVEYPVLVDNDKKMAGHLKATVTPQVILIDKDYQLVYKGAIDNLMQTLGKKRLFATEFFLADAIEKSIHLSGFFVKRTKAVGCSINDY